MKGAQLHDPSGKVWFAEVAARDWYGRYLSFDRGEFATVNQLAARDRMEFCFKREKDFIQVKIDRKKKKEKEKEEVIVSDGGD
ncbi:hypothetical protein LINPERPRIM_LOCUS5841 [Linum perenne]